MIWLIFEIFSQIQILYNEPNHRGDPLKFSGFFFIPNIKMYTFFHYEIDGEKCLPPKMKSQWLFKMSHFHIEHPVHTQKDVKKHAVFGNYFAHTALLAVSS